MTLSTSSLLRRTEPAVRPSRRTFLRSGLAVGGLIHTFVGDRTAEGAELKPAFSDLVIRPRRGVQEATLARLGDRRYWLLFGENRKLVGKISTDAGRSWSATAQVPVEGGGLIELGRDTAHLSLLHLRSGRLGMIHGGPASRPGRDGTLLYRSSENEGKTWSHAVVIDPVFSLCRTSGARVLSSGRIVVPTFNWYSAYAGGESESEDNSLCVSWVFYSDDEGKTWKRSLSELFVSIDGGRNGVYSFEEPSLEELRDGSLLMFGRTELGRFYQTVSKDQGITWTPVRPVHLAASYTPPILSRIPSTGDLLLIWNQASSEEVLAGLSRHRLSTAISKDGAVTWGHFHNLESLDNRARLADPPATPQVYRMVDYEYRQPADRARYPHAPGCIRICYPNVVFNGDEAAITYDYGYGTGEFENVSASKIQIVSLDWLYA